jgi:regulatory protein
MTQTAVAVGVSVEPMDRITDIVVQKRRGSRRSIYVNGEFFAGVGEEIVAELGLRVGQEIDAEKLAEVIRAEEIRSARESALVMLDYRPRTEREIAAGLKRKGYSEEVIATVIERLSDVGLIDDEKFAEQWVDSRLRSRLAGRARIAWELRGKGVNQETIEKALSEVDGEDEVRMARELVAKKMASLSSPDEKAVRRLTSFLRRRGFDWDVISKVLNEFGGGDY